MGRENDLNGIKRLLLIFQLCNWLFYSYGIVLDLEGTIISFLRVEETSCLGVWLTGADKEG